MQRPFCSKKPVDHHFNAADQDHEKAPPDKRVHQTHDRLPEDFCLPESNGKHDIESPAVVFDRPWFGEFEP